MSVSLTRRRLITAFGVLALWVVPVLAIAASARADETVMVCDIYGNHVASRPAGADGIRTSETCPGNAAPASYSRSHPPGGMAIWTVPHRVARRGAQVHWVIRAPTGLIISSVYIPHLYSWGIDDGSDWGGGLYWGGGSGGVHSFDGQSGWSSANSGGPRFRWPSGGTRYFGWRLLCHARRCDAGDHWITIELLELHVRETVKPRLVAPDGLWRSEGWIRGWWALHFYGDSPSGLCAIGANVNGSAGPGSLSQRHPALWHQCSAPPVDQAIDTSQYGQGDLPLTINAVDAAGQSVTYTRTIQVDNQRPTVTLSGPHDASSTAGPQYVRATATAGPSGVAGILCSVDGAPTRLYSAASAAIPVRGVGAHQVSCYSENNARDATGISATSAPASWSLTIRSPSVSTISFVRIANGLGCVHRRERVRIPAHWETAYHHGHRVRVRVPAQTRRVRVVQCHPRVIHRRVRRNGRWVTERVVLLPHRVSVNRLRVPFGSSTLVRGWLGTTDGKALAGKMIRILAAPSNGADRYAQVAVARTGSDGVWRAHLPAGPSRTVIAVYPGSTTVEPSVSKPAHVVVPAEIRLRIQPQSAHWGEAIRISGVVRGGYIPPAGEVVFLWVGWKGGSSYVGHVYATHGGDFHTTYTFSSGHGSVPYDFWATTGRETDYPYAPGRSNRVRVTVSP